MDDRELASALAELVRNRSQELAGVDFDFKPVKVDCSEKSRRIEVDVPFCCDEDFLAALEKDVSRFYLDQTGKKKKTRVYFSVSQRKVKLGTPALKNVRNIVAVGSGKGGVGKSAASANLAVALAMMGAKVGILDADVYGPSQPTVFGVESKDLAAVNKKIMPVTSDGVKIVSIGFMAKRDQPVIWRGAIVNKALEQLLFDADWGDLDYLFIDLAPGTGDIQLTMAQKMPVTCALIVTTPQDLALIDAEKAAAMFRKVNIPILGVLENMSSFVCPHCGHVESIFGSGAGERMAEKFGAPLLGKLPLNPEIRKAMDAGELRRLHEECPEIAGAFKMAATRLTMALATLGKDYSHPFSGIEVVKR